MRICGILTVIAAVMISGCTLGRQPPQGNTSSIATPIPTFTPAPRPTQTPVPVTNLSGARAEQIVLEAVRLCARQLGDGSDAPIITAFTTMYDAKAGDWRVDAFSGDAEFGLGSWQISDANGVITPVDEVAGKIASADFDCGRPGVFLAQGMTPPVFYTPAPTPGPDPTSTPRPQTEIAEREAELVVWLEVLSCADEIAGTGQTPLELGFRSEYDAGIGSWVVEVSASGPGLTFGTWEVDGSTGLPIPLGDVAANVGDPDLKCEEPNVRMDSGLTPPVFLPDTAEPILATGDDARRLVWLAVYGCFSPPPPVGAFTAYEDGANGWIVEGRVPTEDINEGSKIFTYGLWTIEARDAGPNPHDEIARDISRRNCFRGL